MYTLIGMKLASKSELETYYTLDEALKLYSLWQMSQDIEAARADEIKKNTKNPRKGR